MRIKKPMVEAPMIPEAELEQALAAGIEPQNTGLAILQTVRGYGVDVVFGIPGTHNLEFYRHLPRLGIRAVTSRHEQGAGYAADAWAQRTGLPGVVLATSGPGLLNALSAAGTAYCESRPMIILAPGSPRGQQGQETGMLHETKDQLAAAAAIVADARRVESAEAAVEAVHAAFARFKTGRPRPIYIEVPLDLLEEAAMLSPELLLPRESVSAVRSEAEQARITFAAGLLASASRPAVLAGSGSRAGRDDLLRLVERLGAPVVTSSNGKGVIPDSHPLAIGAELRLGAAVEVLNAADVLLIVGSKVAAGEFAAASLAPKGRVIRLDIDPGQSNNNLVSDAALIGDSAEIVAELLGVLPAGDRSPWLELDEVRARCAREAAASDPALSAVAGRIAAALPHNTILTGDSSQICYSGMMSAFKASEPAQCLNMIVYATLGYGLPAAIGAKIATPERPVVCVTGDGALMFSVPELQTASEQGLDVTVICVDNGGYGEIEQNERDRGMDPIAVRLTQPDWPLLAQAFGGRGFSVTATGELESKIAEAIAFEGVALVHVPMALFG